MDSSSPQVRSEVDVFNDLKELCSKQGYLYVMAYIGLRDDLILYTDSLQPEDLSNLYSNTRLIRTETSTLLGLSVQGELSLALPSNDNFQLMIEDTDRLMSELHTILVDPIKTQRVISDQDSVKSGDVFREAFFYSGEAAYYFQYRDFAPLKYKKDSEWILNNRGYSVEDAHKISLAICNSYQDSIQDIQDAFSETGFDLEKLLDCYTFTIEKIATASGLSQNIVQSFVSDFSIGKKSNGSFSALNDFNAFNATPLIDLSDGRFCLFNVYSLADAFYESPFYWMLSDDEYKDKALTNRGDFSEEFSLEQLRKVFGSNNVFTNIIICEGKNHICEIDVLVVFSNRAIVLQAKAKKLTLEARKGNDNKIKEDFKASVQDAYDQGYECATCLEKGVYTFIDTSGNQVNISSKFDYIYIITTVLDSYPALSGQARQFLNYKTTEVIQPPFVMDIFLLDVLCEMLNSPLRFLSYLHTRVNYFENFVTSHELVVLAYHLKVNLYLENDVDMVHLHDDISSSLDSAMLVRREGLEGEDTPEGILTRFSGRPISQLIEQIERQENIAVINLGHLILSASGDTLDRIDRALEQLVLLSQRDGKNHDFGIGIAGTGITIHCNDFTDKESQQRVLLGHCELKKYSQRSDEWFGLVITPEIPIKIRFGLQLVHKWEKSEELAALVPKEWSKSSNPSKKAKKMKLRKPNKNSKKDLQKQSKRRNRRKK